MVAHDPEPALPVPGPVSDHRVDEPGNHDGVNNVGDEVAPLGQGTRHQRGRSSCKHKLEEPLGELVCWNGFECVIIFWLFIMD